MLLVLTAERDHGMVVAAVTSGTVGVGVSDGSGVGGRPAGAPWHPSSSPVSPHGHEFLVGGSQAQTGAPRTRVTPAVCVRDQVLINYNIFVQIGLSCFSNQ